MATNARKLEAVVSTLTILRPRLTEPYGHDVDQCIKLCKEAREYLLETEDGNDDDGSSG